MLQKQRFLNGFGIVILLLLLTFHFILHNVFGFLIYIFKRCSFKNLIQIPAGDPSVLLDTRTQSHTPSKAEKEAEETKVALKELQKTFEEYRSAKTKNEEYVNLQRIFLFMTTNSTLRYTESIFICSPLSDKCPPSNQCPPFALEN